MYVGVSVMAVRIQPFAGRTCPTEHNGLSGLRAGDRASVWREGPTVTALTSIRLAGAPVAAPPTGRLVALFPNAAAVRLSRRMVALAVLAVLAGAAVSLARVAGTGALQSIWEEDARDILDGALTSPGLATLARPAVGYVVVGPRLLGFLATGFPVSWAAGVLSVSAAVITSLLALQVYCASRAHFPSRVSGRMARVVVSAPMLLAPVAENRFAEVYDRPVCLHFFAMYALFWILLWTPARRGARAGALVTVGLTALSTILAVGYLPLAVLRLAVRRDRLSAALLGLLGVGAAVNAIALKTGLASRVGVSVPRLDLIWALKNLVGWAVPTSVLGFRATSGLSRGLGTFHVTVARDLKVIGLAWLLVAVVVGLAVAGARLGLLRPAWTLAALAGGYAVWLFGLTAMANGAIAYRYLVPIELLGFAAAVALLRPRAGVELGRALPALAAFAAFILAISAANYRWPDTHRAAAPRWSDQVKAVTARCAADPRLGYVIARGGPQPYWSIVRIPCHDVIDPAACQPPQCSWLDPPVSAGIPRRRSVR